MPRSAAWVVLAALGLPLTVAAQAYRCDAGGGRIVFQQQPCNDGKRVDGMAASARSEPSPSSTAARGGALCEAHARSATTFPDPESLRIGRVQYLGARPWKLHQELIAARTYGLRINARNGYGAYEGERLYECLLSEDEARVLHFRAAAR